MGKLWQDLVEQLRKRPILWVPVLVADLFGYLLNLGRGSLLRAIVLHQTAQRSALGGAVVHTPLSQSEMQSTTILALLLTWLVYFFRILLYSGAFVATAALVQGYLARTEKPERSIGSALGRHWGGMLELALRTLAVYAIAAVLFGWLSPLLGKQGQGALLHNPWFGYGLTLLVLAVLSATLPPVALRVLAGRAPDQPLARVSQQFVFGMILVASILAAFVGTNSRELALIKPAARYPLEAIGSLLVALPYVFIFAGLALLAARIRADEPSTEA